MKKKISALSLCIMMTFVGILSSCTTYDLPNIEVDITGVQENGGTGMIKKSIKENSVYIYVDTLKSDLSNMSLTYTFSEGATYKYVVPKDPAYLTNDTTDINPDNYNAVDYVDKDYTKPVYICVTAARGIDPSTNKVWTKVWKVQGRMVNLPTKYDFDNWETPQGCTYMTPYDIITEKGRNNKYSFWDTTSGQLTPVWSYYYGQYLNYACYGSQPTDDAVSGKALKLVTSDISWADPTKPRVAGLVFMGELDGENADDQLKTCIGMPFNKAPKTLKFYYKYKVPEGMTDDGYIRVVLFRSDGSNPYLTGYTIKDNKLADVVAYAELRPDKTINDYQLIERPFTYTHDINNDDLKNWKYSLAIYFASSYKGFEYGGAASFDVMTGARVGSELYIDNFEIECK